MFSYLFVAGLLVSPQPSAESIDSKRLLPDIGWSFRADPDAEPMLEVPGRGEIPVRRGLGETMTSSSSFHPEFKVSIDGVEYSFSATKLPRGTLRYIATSDPEFRTPEGVHSGQELRGILQSADEPLREETGWACFVCLDSGWAAYFASFDEILRWVPCNEIDPKDPITGFFKRRGTCGE